MADFGVAMGIRSIAVVLGMVAPGWAAAQAVEPSSTTATYGAWTVTCATPAAAEGAVKICQMTTKLSVKGSDGQVRPLLEVAIGQPVGGEGARIVLQVPMDVALREAVAVSVDAPGSEAAPSPKPQTALAQASYFACVPAGCIADAALTAQTLAALQAASVTNVTFTALTGAQKITVPVPMEGFGDAWSALGLPAL